MCSLGLSMGRGRRPLLCHQPAPPLFFLGWDWALQITAALPGSSLSFPKRLYWACPLYPRQFSRGSPSRSRWPAVHYLRGAAPSAMGVWSGMALFSSTLCPGVTIARPEFVFGFRDSGWLAIRDSPNKSATALGLTPQTQRNQYWLK